MKGVKNHIYTTNTLARSRGRLAPPDFRVTIMLSPGHYNVRIRAVMKNQEFYFKTCDTVRVYMGIVPLESLDIPSPANAQETLPDFGYLLGNNGTINVKLPAQKPVNFSDKDLISNPYYDIYNVTVEYSGNSGDIGLYLEIGENLDSSMSEEISEITASVYPDLHVESTNMADIPIIATSGGKTFMHIPKLAPQKEFKISLQREKILTMDESKNIPSNIQLQAKLYSLNKLADISKATVTVGGRLLSLPVEPWMPSCTESVLNEEVFSNAVVNVLKSGIQYEEILVLNENLSRIGSGTIDLNNMKDKEGSLMISASPYAINVDGMIEEFMITSVAKGKKKNTARSQEFEENIYLAQIDLSKSNHDKLALRINYAVGNIALRSAFDTDYSQCIMIRLSIKFIPANKQTENKECSSGSFSSNINSIIPSLLPDSTLTHQEDQIISYEYSTLYSENPKFKINPYKPEQNRIKFQIKKPSTFRFEAVAYPCFASPIERSIILKSVSKTHNKITSDIIEVGVPGAGNSVLLYIDELMPGSYQLELDYGWLNNYTPNSKTSDEELMDFQVEIYSHYQNSLASQLMHHKDRHLKELENAIRDLSVVNFMDRNVGQYLAENLPLPTHPINKGIPITIPFKIVHEHAQILLAASKNFTYISNIQILRKDSNSLVKKLSNEGTLHMSEILQEGEYLFQLNYKEDNERNHNPNIQEIIFGISDYQNVDKYKTCNAKLLEKCVNGKLTDSLLMMKGEKGFSLLDFETDKNEILSFQLHYNMFLAQYPMKIYFDSSPTPVNNDEMKHIQITKGKHTMKIFGPELSLDEACILVSFVEYESPITVNDVSSIPGITPSVGVQSIYIKSLQKGTSNLPLPSFKDNVNETMFVSTLLLHFDSPNKLLNTQNVVELDLNFDTENDFNFYPQIYYESAKDKIISYIDISDIKPSADILKQFEVTHTKDNKQGSYIAHFVVASGDTLATALDTCNNQRKIGRAQTLEQTSSFYYNDMGIEDFTLAILKDSVSPQSKFYDSESDVFYIEIVYDISSPAFIEVVCEFDISIQNVDMYIFKDFNDDVTLEDQELASSSLEIPSMIESIVSRHTSIYLSQPGKYSVFIIDKKLPMMLKHLSAFEGEEPCALLKISHSIQPFSPTRLMESSIGILSVWPRRDYSRGPILYQLE